MSSNERKPLVSIKCTVYNHEPYLRQCLDGFVMQKTDFAFEAIVHDDASTDKSAEIIREYAEKYPDIIKPIYETENQYSKRDGSLRRIMNEAIHHDAKYIAICEGDDYWTDPYKLQKQVKVFEEHEDVVVCFHQFQVYFEKEKVFFDTILPIIDTNFQIFDINHYISRKKWFTQTLTCMYKRNIKINQYKTGKDLSFFYSILKNGKGYIIHENMATYRIHSNGAWSGINDSVRVLDDLKCIKSIYDFEKSHLSALFLLNDFKVFVKPRFFLKNIKGLYPYYNIIIKEFGIFEFVKILFNMVFKSLKRRFK